MEVNNKTAPVTGQQDQNTISLDLMNRMKLHGMAEAFRESLAGTTPAIHDCGHVPFHAPCTRMRLSLPGCHCTAHQKCGIPLQGLY